MIKKTIYEPETQAEIDYIEAYGKPNPEIDALNAEVDRLDKAIDGYKLEIAEKAETIIDKNNEIVSLVKQLTDCQSGTPPPPPPVEPPPTGDIYFAGNFDGSANNNLLGGWIDWKNKLPFVEGIYFNNQAGAPYVIQDIRKDANRNVMYAQITDNGAGGGTSRAQMTIDMKQAMAAIHTAHRMKLHPDIAYLTNYPGSIRWFTLFEMWNLRDSTQGGDPAGSSRISLSLFKDSGAGQPLYWHIAYEEMQPSERVIWQVKGTAKIPFDKWFTLDILVKRGIGPAGKVKVVITEDGGQPVTVFDISNNTIYRDKTNLYINQWQLFKLYASDQIMDFARNAGKQLSVMYNDVKWYKV